MPVDAEILFARDRFNAFCRHTHVALDGAPTGPLAGLTFGLKDLYDIAGHQTGFGSPDWLRTHDAATATASVATRLLAAGASMVGKTHTEEMAFSLTGENAHYGTPINPAAPDRIPGGSSSGSASAVAGGLVDFAIGSDTGGSVRGPASFCGVYGIRPTHGRIAMDGAAPLAPGFDTCGWFSRDADTLARVGRVLLAASNNLAGGQAGDAAAEVSARAGGTGQLLMATDAFAAALPGVADALAPAVARVTALLGPAQDIIVSNSGLAAWFDVFRTLQFADIREAHGAWVSRVRPTFGPQIQPRFDAVMALDAALVPPAQAQRDAIRAQLDALLADDAVLMLPTMPDIAPLLHASPGDTVAFRERSLGLLCIAGLGGLPQISLPFATHRGCPLGLSLIAARGNDELLLAIAVALG